MPQTREWPTKLRRSAKVMLGVMYVGATVAGGSVSLPTGDHGAWWTVVLGGTAFLMALVAVIAMTQDAWMVEAVACWFVAGAFTSYAVVETAHLVFDAADVSGTATLYICAAAFGLRLVHLKAFGWNLEVAFRDWVEARRRREAQA